MKQWIRVGMASCALLFASAAGAAAPAPQAEAAIVGTWQEGITPQMASWDARQMQAAKTSGVLGSIVQYKADHTFVLYPPCGPKQDALRKVGVQTISGTWELNGDGDLVSQVQAGAKVLKIGTRLTWQNGQMILLNKNGSVAQRAGPYTGPLPPVC